MFQILPLQPAYKKITCDKPASVNLRILIGTSDKLTLSKYSIANGREYQNFLQLWGTDKDVLTWIAQ